jgi:PAS domain S-box-containing protein
MQLGNTQLIESLFAGSGEMAARMRVLDWSATALGPVDQWPQALRISVRIVLGSGYPMCINWGPHHTILYNDAYRPLLGGKHPSALARGTPEMFPETWEFIGPLFARVMHQGQDYSSLTDQLVPLVRDNYLEECYFALSFSPIPDDKGGVGGIFATALETTERVLEARRRHLLRDLASRTAGARNEEEAWRVSVAALDEDRLSLPFASIYEYRRAENRAHLRNTNVDATGGLTPAVIYCGGDNFWQLEQALARDGILIELGNRAAGVSVPNWAAPPRQACVMPIRLGGRSDALGFLIAGIHPGRVYDDAYRQFLQRIVEQITIGLVSARAFEQERRRAEALAELDRAKTAFFSNVSHEFRTPLTLMLGPLEEMLRGPPDRSDPAHQEQLRTVHRNALRLLKLVNTLLDFSRIEAGRMQAVYRPTDLPGLTSEIASAFDSAMQAAGLSFSVECQPMAEPVYVDRDMWEKIVLNLLSNAYKFTLAGEVALTLKATCGAVQLQVRDTGIGIAEEHRPRVFERFHRIEGIQARTYEGTGIGLALVEELVKLHGGNVRVESALGVGSTFTATIPFGTEHLPSEHKHPVQSLVSTKAHAEAYVQEGEQRLPDEPGRRGLAPGPKRELVIVADDNAEMRQYLVRLLRDRYVVHAVANGREALEATRQLRPALVLTDLMMPRLDGFGLLRAIRADAALAATAVILLSARAGEESRVEGLQADADDYLIKPFAARELLARVAVHVRMVNVRRETAEREERLRGAAELERAKLRASEERLAATSRLYRELQRTDAELQLQVELLQQLPVSAWTIKPDGTPDFVNQVWLEFSGQTLDFVRSHPEAWMTAVHPEDREFAAKRFWEGVRAGQGFAFETRALRAQDGSYRWHLQQAVVLRDAAGRVLKFVGTTTDIDDQKRAEEALRQAQADLARINRVTTMGELTASLAHEIKQPISGIITNVGTCLLKLGRGKPDTDEVREVVARIGRDAQRAVEIMETIRSQFEKSTPTQRKLDLNEMIPETIALLRDEAARYNIAIRAELTAALPQIIGDRVQLQQVLMNLIVNGIEATRDYEGAREMVISSQRDKSGEILVSVSDTGIGFSPQLAERIFDPFYTTKPHGTGMGLRISRSIIESHGGRLWAISNEGPGATFLFSIPCQPDGVASGLNF